MKKKLFSIIALLCLAVSGAWAEEVTIGDPTSTTTNNYLPTYSLYNYSLTQQIYTADEIGMGGTINSLTMWLKNTSSYTRNLKIYMKEVSESTFANNSAWVSMTEGNLVATGSLSNGISNPVATTFTLTTPFEYSGTGNLVICFCDVTGSWSSGAASVVMTTSVSQAIRAYRDDTAYDVTIPGVNGTLQTVKSVVKLDIEASNIFNLTKAEDAEAHGTVAFTNADGKAITKAAEGEVVTVTTTPDDNYVATKVIVTPYAKYEDASAPRHAGSIEILQPFEATKTDDNIWTFTMKAANAEVSVVYELDIIDMGPSTAAIEVEVPADQGENGGATDLATFLDEQLLNSLNPSNIKLTLQAGGKYTISKPIETFSSIQIVGDANDPAIIDASALNGAFVQIHKNNVSGSQNEKGFYMNIYNVELKNFIINNLQGSLFSTNGKKYVIPEVTVENVLANMKLAGSDLIVLDFKKGGAVETLTITKSTFNPMYGLSLNVSSPARRALGFMSFGELYSAEGGSALEEAGIGTQTFDISYNTLGLLKGLTHASAKDNALRNIDFNHNIVFEFAAGFVATLNADPTYLLAQNNSFQKLVVGGSIDDTSFEDVSVAEEGATNSIVGNVVLANGVSGVFEGDCALGACPQKDEKIGDPRWLEGTKKLTSKELAVAGDDLAVAINQGVKDGFTKFQLEDDARYIVKQGIVTDKAISIIGKNVKIDASQSSDVFLSLSTTPGVEFLKKADGSNTDYYGIQNVTLKGLQITGLKNSIFYDNNVKYCVVDMTIEDCVLGLETEAVKNEALISFQAGGAKDVTVKNSTVYGNNAVAKYFIRYNNSARLDRYGFDKNTEFHNMTYVNNTFYGLLKSDGQWANYSALSGQNYVKFDVEKNIWYNCGKDIIRRLAGGRFGSGAPLTFDKNTYFNEGADISESEASYDKSGTALTTDPGFQKPQNANFTLSAYSAQLQEKTGDPRWFAEGGHYNPVTGIDAVKTAEKADEGAWYDLQGRKVANPTKGLYIHNGRKVVIK